AGARQLPGGRRTVETVEDVRQVVVFDTGPVVAHDDLPVADGDLHLAAGRAPLRSVVEQVRDRPGDRVRYSVQLGGLEVGHEVDLREVSPRACHDFVDEQIETD